MPICRLQPPPRWRPALAPCRPAATRPRWRAGAAALVLALLAACATRPPTPSRPARDGADLRPPPGLEQVPDAEPRIEPLRAGGPNKPYEALGQRYAPLTDDVPLVEAGLASWYGRKFHGLPTASGETYDMYAMTAAHKTMPIPSYARIRNPANGREVIVRINDRGPFAPGRVVDLSYTAALKLGVLAGVAPVEVARLTHAEIRAGSWRLPTPAAPLLALDDPAPGDASPADPIAAFAGFGAGWWLQIGAFRSRDTATQLQQRVLRELPALPGAAVFDEAGVYRVQAGPYATREQALAASAALQRATGAAALVVSREGAAPSEPR